MEQHMTVSNITNRRGSEPAAHFIVCTETTEQQGEYFYRWLLL